MASKDLYNNVEVVRAISPGTYKADTNPAGQTIDTLGYESVTLALVCGVLTDAQTLTLKHSLDDSAYTDVTADDVIADPDNTAAEVLAAFKTTGTDDHAIKLLGYKGPRRYLKVESTAAGETGAVYGVVALLGHGQNRPVDRS